MKTIRIDKWDAIVFFDEEEKLYTVAYNGNGGACITNPDFEEAKKNFIEAMSVAEGVQKLRHFGTHGLFPQS